MQIQEIIESFKAAILENGVTPPETIVGDGNLHRFKIDGKLNGAYVLHLDGRAAGYFEDFKQGKSKAGKWIVNFNRYQLLSADPSLLIANAKKPSATPKKRPSTK